LKKNDKIIKKRQYEEMIKKEQSTDDT